MRALLAAIATIGLLSGLASAETRYDVNIERAASDIIAGKMGELRGGFAFNKAPVFVRAPDPITTGSVSSKPVSKPARPADLWRDGLAPAVERPITRSFF